MSPNLHLEHQIFAYKQKWFIFQIRSTWMCMTPLGHKLRSLKTTSFIITITMQIVPKTISDLKLQDMIKTETNYVLPAKFMPLNRRIARLQCRGSDTNTMTVLQTGVNFYQNQWRNGSLNYVIEFIKENEWFLS